MHPDENIMVTIRCTVYNHACYIRQCLEGFVKQKTNFRFEAIVHDDASTDGSADIIREYASLYPDIIKPIFQTENQYSKRNGAIGRALNENTRGKYVALCEGDDYWIDSHKLQKQVDFLETHPEYSLVCSDAVVLKDNENLNWHRYDCDCEVPLRDVITKRGAWIHTASMMYRWQLRNDYPEFARKCHVGDYPTTIHLALKGKVHFFAEKMVVYRYMTAGSWSANTQFNTSFFPKWESEIRMLQGFNDLSNRKHEELFHLVMGRIAIIYLRHAPEMKKEVLAVLPDFPKWLSWSDKLKWWKIRLGIKKRKR